MAMPVGLGRDCAHLHALISWVRAGASAASIVKGRGWPRQDQPAGAHGRSGRRVAGAAGRGAESDKHLPFAGMDTLTSPMMSIGARCRCGE